MITQKQLLKKTLHYHKRLFRMKQKLQWFKDNFMIVNLGRFQTMAISRFGKMENKHQMYIENKKLTSEHC